MLPVEGSVTFLIELEAGDLFHVRVLQDQLDLVLGWQRPNGCEVLAVDSPNGPMGPEELAAQVPRRGTYRLQIRAVPGPAERRFHLQVLYRGPATPEGQALAEAQLHFAEGQARRREGQLSQALAAYRRALEKAQLADARILEARARRGIGRIAYQLGDVEAAVEHFERSIPVLRESSNGWEIAGALNDAGDAFSQVGRPEEGREMFEESLRISERLENHRGIAASHNNLGVLHASIGNHQAAYEHYQRALEVWQELGDEGRQGYVLHNLGLFQASLHRWVEAQELLGRAAEIHGKYGNVRSRAETLTAKGWVDIEAGDPTSAIVVFEGAVANFKAIGALRGEAAALDLQGQAYREIGQYSMANDLHERALELNRKTGNRLQVAHSRDLLGRLRLAEGRPREATELHRASLAGFRDLRVLEGEAMALISLARAQHALGRLESAAKLFAEALAIFESSRARLQSLANRSQYSELRLADFEGYVDVLMDLDQRQPGAGYTEQAFEVSERFRARSLLDSLSRSGSEMGSDLPPVLRPREARLRASIVRLEESRLRAAEEGQEADREAAELELGRLLLEYESLSVEGSATSAGLGTVNEPLDLPEVRQRLLDEQTLLLAYHLGRERSYLWVVDRGSLESYRLAPRQEIESLARQAHRLLSRHDSQTYGEQTAGVLRDLSEKVLGPISGRLAEQRLLILSAGALHLVPFAALTHPSPDQDQVMLRNHEIVHLPSASVVARQRQLTKGRPEASKQLAMLADPVFGWDDPRAAELEQSMPARQADASLDLSLLDRRNRGLGADFLRLPFSGQEADAILAMVAERERFEATGLKASRKTALSGILNDFRIVHFAAHGVLDTRHPELSGLMLSKLNADGEQVDGFLRAFEIADLRLKADLVVLSACKTALGKELRSEGLVGLPYSFFRAGAPRVVVSYWNVNDRATAVLMERFYHRMLRDGLRPPAALRAAQLSMLKDERWQAPYYWAGFAIHGDWR